MQTVSLSIELPKTRKPLDSHYLIPHTQSLEDPNNVSGSAFKERGDYGESFVFPTSIERGMLFKDANEVRAHIVKEAIERGVADENVQYSPRQIPYRANLQNLQVNTQLL